MTSPAELLLAEQLRQVNFFEVEREVRFHPTRKWRADFVLRGHTGAGPRNSIWTIWQIIPIFVASFTEPGPIREIGILGLSFLALAIGGLFLLRWVERPFLAAAPPATAETETLTPEQEEIRRLAAFEAEQRPMRLEARLHEMDVEMGRVNDNFGRVRKAFDTALTWLYRRENWDGLSANQRYRDPAPWEIWAESHYQQLDINDLGYDPPDVVPHEPTFTPPDGPTGPLEGAP